MLHFKVDEDLCVCCATCVQECPHQIIQIDEFPVIRDEKACLRCQHCLAVCPEGAISILGHSAADSIACDSSVLDGKLPDPRQMELLVKSRRSVRQFKDQDVDPSLLRELTNLANHAPTGSNKRSLLVTLVDTRASMDAFRNDVYSGLTAMAAANTLPAHPRSAAFADMARRWKGRRIVNGQGGQDIIFRNAPHALILSNGPGVSCAREDALIFLSYFDLLAHSRGVGTLWAGLLYWCLQAFLPQFRTRLGIPADHTLGYCMLLGMPSVEFYRTVEQSPPVVNTVRWE